MQVWDVFGKRSPSDDFSVVGAVKAPDREMALLLARESYFRHKEGVSYGVRGRGEGEIHVGPEDAEVLGGVTDRSYRRQEGYVGVGAKLKRVHEEMSRRGLVIRAPRPAVRRAAAEATRRSDG